MEGVTSIEREIAEVRKSIRAKYNKLRRSREDDEERLRKKYKPLQEILIKPPPVKEHITTKKRKLPKRERKRLLPYSSEEEDSTQISSHTASSDHVVKRKKRRRSYILDVFEIEKSDEEDLKEISSETPGEAYIVPSGEAAPSGATTVTINKTPVSSPTPKLSYVPEYVNKKINKKEGLDDTYGIQYHEPSQQFTMGDSYVTFEDDKLHIGSSMTIECTRGLLELLFIRDPDWSLIGDHDLESYKKILDETNAHRKRFSSSEMFHVDLKHPKWKIIRMIYSTKKPSSK